MALSRLIDRQQVRCEEKGKSGPAVLAQCWVGERDLAEVLATQGFAEATPKVTDAYAAAAARARAEKRGMWAAAQPAAPKPQAAAATTAAKSPAAKPAAAKPAAKAPARAPAASAAAQRPQSASLPPATAAAPAGPRERRIGEVMVFDIDGDPFVRLEGPKRELTYEQRLQLTSYVQRDNKLQQFMLTIFSTHHDADARAYAQALTDANEKLEIAAAVPPRKQCVKNKDKSTVCFVDEGYTVTIPDRLLRRNRGKGIRLQLAGGGAKPMLVSLDAAMVDGQLNASDEVARNLR